jgi:DNA-binding NarL/FixJ family response regulator
VLHDVILDIARPREVRRVRAAPRPPRRDARSVSHERSRLRSLSHDEFWRFVSSLSETLLIVDPSGKIQLHAPGAHGLLAAAGRRDGDDIGPALQGFFEQVRDAGTWAPQRMRLSLRDGASWRLMWQRMGPEAYALLARCESLREGDLHGLLMTHLALDAAAARLALRVYRGWSNEDVARAFGLRLGTVKSRLSRLYERLRVERRSALVRVIDEVVARVTPHASADSPAPGLVCLGPAPSQAALGHARAFLEGADFGLAALDGGDEWLWTNAQAVRLLFDDQDTSTAARRLALQAARGGGGTCTAHLRQRGGGLLRLRAWPAGDGLAGPRVHQQERRFAHMAAVLTARFGLTSHQAQMALLIADGRSNAEIAEQLGIQESSVRSQSAAFYERLGIDGRIGLVMLLADLAGWIRD